MPLQMKQNLMDIGEPPEVSKLVAWKNIECDHGRSFWKMKKWCLKSGLNSKREKGIIRLKQSLSIGLPRY